jgi:CRP-like cAMP-binding protein
VDQLATAINEVDVEAGAKVVTVGERSATVVARTPMQLLSLSGQDFQRIRAGVPELKNRSAASALSAPAGRHTGTTHEPRPIHSSPPS